MLRSILQLGQSPLVRRIIAAVILIGVAVATAFARGQGVQLWIELGANLTAAIAALVLLHFRWRSKERKSVTRGQLEDTFS